MDGSANRLHQSIRHIKSNFKTPPTIEIWMNWWENMTFQKHSKSWFVTSHVSRKKRILYRYCKNRKTKKIRSLRNRLRKNWFSSKYKNQLWEADFVFYAHLWIVFCQVFSVHFPASVMLSFFNLTPNTTFWARL